MTTKVDLKSLESDTVLTSFLLRWIPTRLKNEIVMVCSTLLVVANLVASFTFLNGAEVHDVSIGVAILTGIMGVVARGLVVPAHQVVATTTTTPEAVLGTSGPVEAGTVPPELTENV